MYFKSCLVEYSKHNLCNYYFDKLFAVFMVDCKTAGAVLLCNRARAGKSMNPPIFARELIKKTCKLGHRNHTFQRQANVTQDFIMKNTVEQRKDKKETERNNNFSARSY